MAVAEDRALSELGKEMVRLAREGDLDAFLDAMLEHPVHGRVLRAFALEGAAPEFEETTRRIREKSGPYDDARPHRHAG